MSTLDDREKGFERKFAHDAEMQFKAEARRNRLLGHWAAEKMGISGEAADVYAKEVIASDFEEAGDEDVYRKVSRRPSLPRAPTSRRPSFGRRWPSSWRWPRAS